MTATLPRRLLLAGSAVLSALLGPAPAMADDLVADLARDTPISAYGGAVAWSAYDVSSRRYGLVIRQGHATAAAAVKTARSPFDVSLGPDSRGRIVALYTRCRGTNRACDIYRYDLRMRRESKLLSISSPSIDEAWPAQWRDRVTFARRARTHVIDGYDHRPDPRGRGPVMDCDIPYVKTLGSLAPSRRLDRSQCGATTGMAIRGATIIHVTDTNQGGAGSESQVRVLRAGGGAARILARTRGGEGGYSPFRSPNLSSSDVWLTRTGLRQDVQQGFVRIDRRSRRLTTVTANLNLAGRVARDERGRFWYVQGPEPEFDFHNEPPLCRSLIEPCRLVRASANPFSATRRTLLPRLTIAGAGWERTFEALAVDPPVLSGALSRTVVSKGAVVGSEAVPGVDLTLLRTASMDQPGPFSATGRTVTTDVTGQWAFALVDPPPDVALAVVAPALKVASVVVQVTSSARITLSASGRELAGTVAPAQPGRNVEIQLLLADERGRLPNGRQVCGVPRDDTNCADAAWTTVAQAPLGAPGTAFSATVTAAGVYRARLPVEANAAGVATQYGGSSPEVNVA